MASTETAQHAHGTWQKYRYDHCRCEPCGDAYNSRRRARTREDARAQWDGPVRKVDAGPVRGHVRNLMAQGVGWHRIARIAGVSNGCVSSLLYGHPATGRPTTWLRPKTAERLLAVTVSPGYVDGTGIRRRVQALVALGWSGSELMRRLGRDPRNWPDLCRARQVQEPTAVAVRRLYDELWDVLPPAGTRAERASVTRSRNLAQLRGWPPPLWWDDDEIDVPEAAPAGDCRG